MTTSAGSSIAARYADYYRRQIQWAEDAIVALDVVLRSTDEPDYDKWIEEDAVRARRLDDLVAEHAALKKEWDATASVGDRAAVAALVRRLDELRQSFDAKRIAVTVRLAKTVDALRGEAGDLRRGRENARKYGTGDASDGAIVDRRI